MHDVMRDGEMRCTMPLVTDDPTTGDWNIAAHMNIIVTNEGIIADLIRDSDGEVIGTQGWDWSLIVDNMLDDVGEVNYRRAILAKATFWVNGRPFVTHHEAEEFASYLRDQGIPAKVEEQEH